MMQASHPDVHQEGSHFGPVEASQSNIFQGNFSGTINATVAAPVTPSRYEGHYSHSSLQPVPNYIQRPALHEKLRKQIHHVQTARAEEPRIGVVWGLGGAGKSQLVRNYIHTYGQDYSAVFWIEAGSKESIERDYIQIYRLLYGRSLGAGQETLKVEDAVPAIKHWFYGREGQWLIVLDSADNIDDDQDQAYIDLRYFMPDAPGVYIILTSRSSTAREMAMAEAVEVAEMEPSEAAELFQRSAKIIGAKPAETREIEAIVGELGCLALAITLAGSYVSMTPRLSSDLKRYLPEYRQRRKELLHRRPKQSIHQYGESVLSMWESSFTAIEHQHPAAARLLSLLVFVNFEDIFTNLFDRNDADIIARTSASPMNQSAAAVFPNQAWRSFLSSEQLWTLYDLETAFEILQSYSLIQWRSDQRSYSMHKLVHAWGYDRLAGEQQRQLSFLALELLADATAQKGVDPSYQIRLMPHAMVSFRVYSQLNKQPGKIALDILAMIDRIEGFVYRLGRWLEAYEIRIFHFTKTEIMLGKEHPSTLTSMNNLAEVLSSQGSYEEAERMHRQALALRESVLGKEHPETLTNMNNLAGVLSSQGSYEEAERMHRQALALKKSVLGKEHPSTLTSMNNLALVLNRQGSYEEAERMHRQALALKESVLGKEYPSASAGAERKSARRGAS